jgi:hypothetical protein
MLRIRGDVPSGAAKEVGVFSEKPECIVAAHAQEPADLPGAVVMIDVQ